MDGFRSIDEIPLPYRNVLIEYPCFNAVQSQVLDDILYTDNSVVVSAPTGSGKTAIFELAIIRLLIQYENIDVSQKIKIVYICPIKALCHERLSDWHKKFSPFGLNCVAATGDSDNFDFQQLKNHNLIISTPEKWDSLTRKWKDNEKIVRVVKLFMIDEVHLLNEESRGSTLEVIVCRMKTVENSMAYSEDESDIFNQKVRYIAVSATVPNVEDIALWIGKPSHTKHYKFSEEMRPVKLKKVVYGYSYNFRGASPFKFDISLNYKLPALMMQYSEGKPTLIFCTTRKSVEMTANHLVHSLKIHLNEEQTRKLVDVANMIADAKAKATVRHGVAYHHAGMIPETRHAIETIFRNGDLPVLVTTSTLSMGVNLPAHLVIVKSTKCYEAGSFRDYTDIAIHQMIGRAGRPQFDTSATALILTTNEDKHKFEKMVSCGQPIESNLHRHLTEHMNAEIVLGTITDLDVAMQWLSSTFLYVRARKNPRHYGINMDYTQEQIDKKLLEMCQIDLNKLVSAGMITIDQNIVITANVTGKIMAKYYVAFETMKLFTQISGTEILMQILAVISKCQEFAVLYLRVNDKKTLNLLNKNSKKDTIRFPLNGKIKTWDMKVNCIIQAVLGNLDILDHSILNESLTITRNGQRVAKCLIEYLETRGSNSYSALLNAVILGKCFHAKLWENSPFVSKQLRGIGSVMSKQLANAGKTTFKKIMDSNPRDLELIIKKKPPVGNTLVEEVEHIPCYKMTVEKIMNGKQLRVCVSLENVDDMREKSTVNTHSTMVLLVGDNSNEILAYEKYAHSYMIEHAKMEKIININPKSEEIFIHFISADWVGFDCNSKVQIQSNEVQKTSKKVGNESPNKKHPAFVQKFLDMYMKPKKKIPAEKKTPVLQEPSRVEEKNSKVVKKCDSSTDVERESEGLKTDNFINKSDKVPETENLPNENDVNLSQGSLFSDVDGSTTEKTTTEVEKCISTHDIEEYTKETDDGSEDVQKTEDFTEPDGLINIKERVAKTPSLFFLSKKYELQNGENNNQSTKLTTTNKRKSEDISEAVVFEDSLHKENMRRRQTLEDFKFPTKKKLSHNPDTMVQPDSTADNQLYTITEILEPSEKRRVVDNRSQPEINFDHSPKERSKGNYQKSITWRSPLVFSPAEKFSPKIRFQSIPEAKDYAETYVQNESTNETFETSSFKSNTNLTGNIQRTPKPVQTDTGPRHANKTHATPFPLRDEDYDISNKEPFDICSTSFLEMVGLPTKQRKSTPKCQRSPTVNYYSQLLYQATQAQKSKTQETPRLDDENTKKVDLEDRNVAAGKESVCEEDSSRKEFSSVSQIESYREDILNTQQDVRDFNRERCISRQNSPVLHSESRYIPQMNLSRSFTAKPTPYLGERCPYSHPQNYGRGQTLNYPYEERSHNSHVTNQEFVRDSYALAGPSSASYNYCNYPKISQRSQFEGNVYGRTYQNTENAPIYSNRELERNLSHEAVNLNQSQFAGNSNCEDFLRKGQYSRYFPNDRRRRDDFHYQLPSKPENERDYRMLDDSPTENWSEKYPEMASLQDLNQQRKLPPATLTWQKSFKETVNGYDDLRNLQKSFPAPVIKEQPFQEQKYAPTYEDGSNTRFLQRCPVRSYKGECLGNPRGYSQTQVPRNEFYGNGLVKNLNRSFSFEDKPNFAEADVNLTQRRGLSEQMYELEGSFPPRYSQEQDFGYRSQFGHQQIPDFNRSFVSPWVPYPEQNYFPSNYREMEIFPPNNDKEYVMNKFLYSLNQ